MKNDTITITRVEFITLKRLYTKAVKAGEKQFVFMGRDILTAYAKYLIQYLEGKF